MRFNDAVLGFIILAFGAAVALYADLTFPALPGQEFGPAFFPTIIGAVLSGCGLILLIQGLAKRKTVPLVEIGEWARMPRHVVNFVLVFLALLVYILFTDSVGFIPDILSDPHRPDGAVRQPLVHRRRHRPGGDAGHPHAVLQAPARPPALGHPGAAAMVTDRA